MTRDLHIDLEDMILFYYVIEKGGFYKAAEALNISQPKVSRRISKLEDYFGTQLLYRSVKGVALTESGDVILRMSKAIVENVSTIRHQVQAGQTEAGGKVTLSIATGFSNFWFMPFLAEFFKRYPKINIHLKNNDIGDADLLLGDADIVVDSSRPQDRESIECRVLCEYPLHLYASEDYLKKKGIPSSIKDLDHHDVVAWREPLPDYLPLKIFNGLLYLGRDPRSPRPARILVENDIGIVTAISNGLGLGIMPRFLGEAFPHVKRVPFLSHDGALEGFTHKKYISYPKTLKNSEKHRKIIDFLDEKAQEYSFFR